MTTANASRTGGVSRRVRDMVAASLIAALMAASAWLSIPVGAVPVTLQTFVVALAALILPPAWAAGAMAIYVAVGAAGVPVFSNGHAGVGVVVGPTGGYLVGFIVAAGLASWVRIRLERAGTKQILADAVCGVVLLGIVYGTGTLWLSYSLHVSLAKAALVGIALFVIADAIKVAFAIVVATAVRRSGVRL